MIHGRATSILERSLKSMLPHTGKNTSAMTSIQQTTKQSALDQMQSAKLLSLAKMNLNRSLLIVQKVARSQGRPGPPKCSRFMKASGSSLVTQGTCLGVAVV